MGLPLVEQNTAVPRVCLIITAWNQVAKTVACLETVFALAYAPKALEVVLIDNGSQPELAIAVKQQFPHLTYMRHEQNRGFAGGYNSGLRYALTHSFDYICLLNNDTLVAPDMLSHLVEAAQAEPSWGVVSAKVYYADDRQRIWTVGERVSP
ncbi:MAG: glycosyltransferase, partial [Anaerolineales bacterium]|nr:glycosyltransferase [Anaerolineales bacterium]